MRLDEVPEDLRQRIIDKWSKAATDGWEDVLWQGCALCQIIGKGCPKECPLYPDGWCVKYSRMSKLHPDYGSEGMFRGEALEAWRSRVREFVRWLEDGKNR